MPTYTIGHGTWHQKDRFIETLQEIDILLDCRSHPQARIIYYWKSQLEKWVPKEVGIEYRYFPQLGGFSKEHQQYENYLNTKFDLNLYTGKSFPMEYVKQKVKVGENQYIKGFVDFQWFMTLPPFFEGITEVIKLSKTKRVAMMCAEAWWYDCHRSMLADYLLIQHNIDTIHLRQKVNKKPMMKIKHSEVIGNRREIYSTEVIEIWNKNPIIVEPSRQE